MDLRFSQVFGERSPTDHVEDVDLITAIEYDQSGDYLATGDRGGRLVLFVRDPNLSNRARSLKFNFYAEFQSHEPEFDYLKSLEIEEKINCIRWCPRMNQSNMLLSCNDKTIKLWKIAEKRAKQFASMNAERLAGSRSSKHSGLLSLPTTRKSENKVITTTPRRVYSNAHAYHVNSIGVCADGEHFISADDLRVNLWNLETASATFTVVDMKPPNIEDLAEVITTADTHPVDCSQFAFGTSQGQINLCDLRRNALCDTPTKVFKEDRPSTLRPVLFREIVNSLADVRFSRCGRYLFARDYMTLKVWDVNMERGPIKTINVQDHLRDHLSTLYDREAIYDKFRLSFSGDGNYLIGGTYNNSFGVYSRRTGNAVAETECSKAPAHANRRSRVMSFSRLLMRGSDSAQGVDWTQKVLHVGWHPKENVIAVGALSSLYFFTGTPTS